MTAATSSPAPRPSTLSADVAASLVVFLVAVPLSLGIASGSGAPVMAGMIAAAIGGIVVGIFGGAPLLVSGPAAGLITLVLGAVTGLGFGQALAAFAIAGAIQLLASIARLGRFALAIPPAVVHGMLAGIGIIIATQQLRRVLGDDKTTGKVVDHVKRVFELLPQVNVPSLILGGTAFAILMLWPKLPAKVRKVPAALVAVAVPTIIGLVARFDVARVKLPDNLAEGFRAPEMPTTWGPVAIAALTIAFIASVESLLSAVATDRLHDGPRANLDKELRGQGLANMLSGLVGGIPITGVIVRSKANIDAGARTKLSAILHGVWVILFVAFLGVVIEAIPFAVLGGLLVHVGFKLVNPDHIRGLLHAGQLPAYLATVAGVVFEDLLIGVAIGTLLYVIMNFRLLGKTSVATTPQGIAVDGKFSTFGVPAFMKAAGDLPATGDVEVRLPEAVDHAAAEAVHALGESVVRTGRGFSVTGPGHDRYARLVGHG